MLPWVDSNDKNWQKEKEEYNPNSNKDSNAQARYRDMETLKYVLRAIETNCPWYNKIYLITQGHYPKWLNINHPKIELVTHQDLYFDKSHLPTFNSSSIEMNLANLKQINDKFIYLNDDFIIMNPLNKSRFFKDNKPVDFLSHGWVPRNEIFSYFKDIDTWINSLNNNLKLINQKFDITKIDNKYLYHQSYNFKTKISNFLMRNIYKKVFWLEHWHHPQPYLKQTLKNVYIEFKEEMMICSANKFRMNNDLTQYLYRYWHLIKGDFYPYKYNDGLVANLDSLNILQKLTDRIKTDKNINFVCFNDSVNLSGEEFFKIKEKLINFLEKRFPEKASFEMGV